jgi:transcriptional regulator with XRE-family HTH domain
MTESRKLSKAAFSLWMRENMERLKLSQNELARKTGLSANTINRYCRDDDDAEPKASKVHEIAAIFGTSPPPPYAGGFPASANMPEPGVEMLKDEPGPDWNGSISRWRVRDLAMSGLGYMTGDEVMADARITPVDGDVVVAELTGRGASPRMVLRMFRSPGYLLSATIDVASLEVHEIGKNADVLGVVVESVRRRKH